MARQPVGVQQIAPTLVGRVCSDRIDWVATQFAFQAVQQDAAPQRCERAMEREPTRRGKDTIVNNDGRVEL
jgi:hypothetical protein